MYDQNYTMNVKVSLTPQWKAWLKLEMDVIQNAKIFRIYNEYDHPNFDTKVLHKNMEYG